MRLKPFQIEELNFAIKHPRYICALDTGLGKSAVSINTALQVRAKRCLIVCPAYLIFNWENEVKIWADRPVLDLRNNKMNKMGTGWASLPAFDICSYEYARDKEFTAKYDMLIVDEAHYLKNGTTQRTRAIATKLASRIPRVVFLTATPYVSSAVDLHPLLSMCEPGKWGPPSAFGQKYAWEQPDNYSPTGFKWVGVKDERKLRRDMAHVLRTTSKDDVDADLPPISYHYLYMKSKLKNSLKDVDLNDPVALQKALDKVSEENQDDPISTARKALAFEKVKFTHDWLLELPFAKKCVVFGWHKEPLYELAAELKGKRTVAVITGDTPMARRAEIIQAFQNGKIQVLIGSIAALGTGVNLTAATIGVFMELPWTFAEFKQCRDRLHRIGSTQKVSIYRIISQHSLDHAVIASIKSKLAGSKQIAA